MGRRAAWGGGGNRNEGQKIERNEEDTIKPMGGARRWRWCGGVTGCWPGLIRWKFKERGVQGSVLNIKTCGPF